MLPAAVPPYQPDAAALHQRIGELSAYNLQLMELLRERAIEANALDDRVRELMARLAANEAKLWGLSADSPPRLPEAREED